MSRVLVVPDLHEPCARPGALEFCKDLRKKYKTDTTVFIGDVTDWHSISFHAHHTLEVVCDRLEDHLNAG